jgi:hypothetical protein
VTSPHTVRDTATLTLGTVTVTLSGSAAYTSATSYVCVANSATAATSSLEVSNESGSKFTITSSNNKDAGAVGFVCTGN